MINLSIGGTASSKTEATIFRELRANGVVVVAAMGNEFEEGNPKEFPAAYDGVLAVGAVDETDRRALFSCTGAHIGLVAPGVSVLSTVPRQRASFAETTDYDSWPGTSVATPHVAGATALLYARRSKSNPSAETIVKRLQSTAKKLAEMKKKAFTHEYGSGLLDPSIVIERLTCPCVSYRSNYICLAAAMDSELILAYAIKQNRYPRGGRRRSLNQARYSPAIFARCAADARRLQVAASSLLSGAPQRSSAQSLTLYAISSAGMRSSTSLSLSVHCEPSVRV